MAISTGAALLGAGIAGGVSSYMGAKKSAGAVSDANASQVALARELAQFEPYNIGGLFGQARFNTGNNTANFGLSGFGRNISKEARRNALRLFRNAAAFNPETAAAQDLALQRQFDMPEEFQLMNRHRANLFGRGILGATAGGLQTRALDTALQLKDLARVQSSMDRGYNRQAQLFGMANNSLANVFGLDDQMRKSLILGADIGNRQSTVGAGLAGGVFGQPQIPSIGGNFMSGLGGSILNRSVDGILDNIFNTGNQWANAPGPRKL